MPRRRQEANCAVASIDDDALDIDEYSVPRFDKPVLLDLPECTHPSLAPVIQQYEHLFRSVPGKTSEALHYIPTSGSPARVPPRRIPAHYRADVERQLHEMLRQGIIEESSSPWMAPAVFVPKKSGDIRICD